MSRILITGESSGFGAMTAQALADAGHTVYAGMRNIADRNREAAQKAGEYSHVVEIDVSDQASVDAAVKQAGHLDAGSGHPHRAGVVRGAPVAALDRVVTAQHRRRCPGSSTGVIARAVSLLNRRRVGA